ncbi:MAG: hypothetical protein ABI376_09950 [Caulobacteraceae bacterium]
MAMLKAAVLAGFSILIAAPALAQGASPGTRRYCDARWRQMNSAGAASTETYSRFLDRCLVRCLPRDAPDGQSLHEGRGRRSCDARWQAMLLSNTAGEETYDQFIRRCDRACAVANTPPLTSGAGVFLAWIASFVAVEAATGGGDRPASP